MTTPLAFYAPLKPPDHPNPSGDRLLAQLLMSALDRAGFDVRLASRLRSRDGTGQLSRQQRLEALGERLAQRLLRHWQRQGWRPRLWFTYHLYYKAPDWIGPAVCRALGIPYVVAEASWAAKRAQGPWAYSQHQLKASLALAQCIFTFNPADAPGLRQLLGNTAPIVELPPFLQLPPRANDERRTLAHQYNLDAARPWLISVAMMRPGDKLASYRQLAQALRLVQADCQLLLVGDGSARASVARAFADDRRVRFTGQLATDQLLPLLGACDLMVWPAVNEAFGMALLEAQALGVPAIAGDYGGVGGIVSDGETGRLTPRDRPELLAAAIDDTLAHPTRLARWRRACRPRAEARHSLDAAARLLRRELEPLCHD
ncbi:glycosyl transferase family 1 [Marinobacterium nitratireducens]|uniref:Glycosyl transferase family 1 n=1 Tax=Marinobacterium nitratireducens TaxID=518897 RepID=A0A918DRG1_9GAMM|nr:glycosyltransferase family 4 protein [Marinobacterium nitratireducens]GGO81087.1 glycosyl transferase family 1 [Marinobacterium nitratireducens]